MINFAKHISFLLSFVCILCSLHAQDSSHFTYQKNYAGEYVDFTVDNLENVYVVNNSNQLKKLYPNGDSVGVFNNVRKYGKLTAIDVTNPLKLLLYYKNFATVVVLDRFLNIRNVINLRKQNIFNVSAIGTSYDNNIWIFDEGDGKIKKIDDVGEVIAETVDLRTIFDSIPSPVKITDVDGFVHLYDPEKGFYIFDIYGALKNKLPYLHWLNTEIIGQTLYGFDNKFLYQYQLGSLQLKQYALPTSIGSANQIKAANGKVYTLHSKGIDVYTVQ
jgi:hypothetical protein